MRIEYLVDRELDVTSGGQGGGEPADRGVDVAKLLVSLDLPEVAVEHIPFI